MIFIFASLIQKVFPKNPFLINLLISINKQVMEKILKMALLSVIVSKVDA